MKEQHIKDAEVLERLRQALLRLNEEDMKAIAESDVFHMTSMNQITKHFEYIVSRNAELRRLGRQS